MCSGYVGRPTVKLANALAEQISMGLKTGAIAGGACIVLLAASWASPATAGAKPRACNTNLNPSLNIVQPRASLLLSGGVCSKGRVRIQQRRKGSWRRIGRTRADRGGGFAACVQLRPTGKRKVRLRAVGRRGARARATVRISAQGGSGCELHLLKEDL